MKHKTVIDKRRIKTMNWINNNLVFPGIKGAPRCPDEVSKLCKKYASLIGKPSFTMHGTIDIPMPPFSSKMGPI